MKIANCRRFAFSMMIGLGQSVTSMGFFLMNRSLDSRSKGLGFDSHNRLYIKVLSNFSFYAVSVHSAVMHSSLNSLEYLTFTSV